MIKPTAMSGGPAQIWNSAAQLAQVPHVELSTLIPPGARVVVVAPHPGDEVVACGGLLQLLSSLDYPLQLISVTDGSASHPGSSLWPPKRLSVFRAQESAEALRRLGMPLHSLKWLRGGFADSALAVREQQLSQFIARYLQTGDVVLSTWRTDGNDDHDAVGRAAASACALMGVRLLEMPIWAWHWPARDATRIPWSRARKIHLETRQVARKRHAAYAYASQLAGDPQICLAPMLPPVLLERMRDPYEIVFV
ncbi:PIG-L family deacetylase [Pseudomonas sp. 15FMM2]|uniref:PIG-L family deacetylase n=1 Tax=Pseudomonas imrae TaxID=2992837 RepID=A0ACC7PCX1_9PSED